MAEACEIGPEDPAARVEHARQVRTTAANNEAALGVFPQPCNGDEDRYPNRIGNFHKSLPHNAIGEVDPAAYQKLLDALEAGSFDQLEQVPRLPTATGRLSNPLGGLAFNMEGPDSPAVSLRDPTTLEPIIPPPIASAEAAAEAAEVYWMAYLRDVPFTDYEVNPVVQQACDDLSRMSGYRGPREAGRVTPQLLFRYAYPGATVGPMVSQFLYQNFEYDGIAIEPRMDVLKPVLKWNLDGTFTFAGGFDFLTSFAEWLDIQNGIPRPGNAEVPDGKRFVRSVRDLGTVAGSDTIFSVYFRGMKILGDIGAKLDAGNPYNTAKRQTGAATLGGIELPYLVGSAHKAERHSWYQKWFVHRHLRPEAFGGLVDNHVQGRAVYPLHTDLLSSPVLPKIAAYNQLLNKKRFSGSREVTYLLPQEGPNGGPSHPSATAGHAISAGACVTMLKAWFHDVVDANDPNALFPEALAKKPNRDGTALEPYVYAEDGPLTIGGELNKLTHNLSAGRDMRGIHWRVSDDLTGNYQGEEVAVRILREAKATRPEFGHRDTTLHLARFNGEAITI